MTPLTLQIQLVTVNNKHTQQLAVISRDIQLDKSEPLIDFLNRAKPQLEHTVARLLADYYLSPSTDNLQPNEKSHIDTIYELYQKLKSGEISFQSLVRLAPDPTVEGGNERVLIEFHSPKP